MDNVYFIVGPHGVGKTFFVNEIRKNNEDLIHVDTGPLMREIYGTTQSDLSLKDWIMAGEKKYGEYFTDMLLAKRIKYLLNDKYDHPIVITGNRSIEGIYYLVQEFQIGKPSIIFLDAPFYSLKTNYEEREKKGLNNCEFGEIIDAETKQGLDVLRKYVQNNPDTCYYYFRNTNDEISNNRIYEETIGIKNKVKKLGGLK